MRREKLPAARISEQAVLDRTAEIGFDNERMVFSNERLGNRALNAKVNRSRETMADEHELQVSRGQAGKPGRRCSGSF